MNPLTLVKRIQKMNSREADLGISEDASWHAKYKDSAYVFVGGIPYDLTEGDLLAIFAQYGELVDVNLVRDKASGKPKGFAFIAYEDQRSTNLAVDNLNGAQILGRTVRVDHVTKYKKKEEEDEEEEMKKREERGVCRAFQKGECTRGAGCKFSHDEQRAANTGWGHEEDRQSRLGYDKSEDQVTERQKKEERGVCFAFQRGECTRGAGCKFSHDEQRAANTGWGNEEDRRSRLGRDKFEKGSKPERRPVDIPSGRDRESVASARHKANELDAGRSRRREDESYRKPSETDYKDRDGRDKSRQLEVQEKVVHTEERDTRGAGENYGSRGEKRSRRHDTEEDELDAGRSRRREDESYRKPSETDKDRDGRDKSRQLEVQEKVVHKEERDTRGAGENYDSRGEKRSRRHDTEEDELDSGRSRRREDESYRKPSETDYKDRDGRDKSRQLEVQEKVVHKEERDTRGAGENYDSRGEKRSRRHDTEEFHPRENRDDRERDRERQHDKERGKENRSSHARDSSSLRS